MTPPLCISKKALWFGVLRRLLRFWSQVFAKRRQRHNKNVPKPLQTQCANRDNEQNQCSNKGAMPFVLPVLTDKADRIDGGETYPDWIFRLPGKKSQDKMEWLFAPMKYSIVYNRLNKFQQKKLEAKTLGITTTAPSSDRNVDDAQAEILEIVGAGIQEKAEAVPIADAADVFSDVPTAARGRRGKVLRESNEINIHVREIMQIQYRSTKVLLLEFVFWTLLRGHRCQCVGQHGRCSSLLEDPEDIQLGLCFFCSLNCNCECYACSGLAESASDSDDNIKSLPACLSGFRAGQCI